MEKCTFLLKEYTKIFIVRTKHLSSQKTETHKGKLEITPHFPYDMNC